MARRLLDDYRKLRQTQAVFARELGMTPAARIVIKASGTRAAFDLASAMSSTWSMPANHGPRVSQDGEGR